MVKPPQNPVVSNKHMECEMLLWRAKSPYITPMSRHPIRFTVSVAQGKDEVHAPFISAEIRNLSAPPKKLPAPTIRIYFSIASLQFLSVLKGIPHPTAQFYVAMMDGIVDDEVHLLHIRFAILGKEVLVHQHVHYLRHYVVALL